MQSGGSRHAQQSSLTAGNNLSAKSTVLEAVAIVDASGQTLTYPDGTLILPDYSGNSNQPYTFRYRNADASYIYNLDTSDLPAGDLTMRFTASDTGDIEYVAPFRLG